MFGFVWNRLYKHGILAFTTTAVALYMCFSIHTFIMEALTSSQSNNMRLVPTALPHIALMAKKKNLADKRKANTHEQGIRAHLRETFQDSPQAIDSEQDFRIMQGNITLKSTGMLVLVAEASNSSSSSASHAEDHFWDHARWTKIMQAPILPCAGHVRNIPVIDAGRYMVESVQGRRVTISVPPVELLRSWGMERLADEYATAEGGGWIRHTMEWIQKMPIRDLMRASQKPLYEGLPALASQGRFKEAAMSLSFHQNGSQISEPWPGVLVLRNALFTGGTQAMHE